VNCIETDATWKRVDGEFGTPCARSASPYASSKTTAPPLSTRTSPEKFPERTYGRK
jgi:hypothetical protein